MVNPKHKIRIQNRNPDFEIRNPKLTAMNDDENNRHYDLEERTFQFAKNVRSFVRKLSRTIANIEDGKQLINAS